MWQTVLGVWVDLFALLRISRLGIHEWPALKQVKTHTFM